MENKDSEDTRHAEQARVDENNRFARILAQSQQQFQATLDKTGQVLSTTQAIAGLAKQNLENVTGSESFPYAVPQSNGPSIPLVLHNSGPNILSGIYMTVARTQDHDWGSELFKPIQVGTIAPYGFAMIPVVLTPVLEPRSGHDFYWIFIYAQNGMVDEGLSFRQSKKAAGFAYSFRVSRQINFDRSGNVIDGVKGIRILVTTGWSDEPPRNAK